MSEYDPLFAGSGAEGSDPEDDDLQLVQERFLAASRPFLRSPWPWLAWSAVLPAAALATGAAARRFGPAGVLFTWSVAILLGGAVEGAGLLRTGRRGWRRSSLAGWVLGVQGNLSLVALALSGVLLWNDAAERLPGLWLLLLGHSFYAVGGLAFPPFRSAGLILQAGGLAALWPSPTVDPLWIFAAAAAAGNLRLFWGVWKLDRPAGSPGAPDS